MTIFRSATQYSGLKLTKYINMTIISRIISWDFFENTFILLYISHALRDKSKNSKEGAAKNMSVAALEYLDTSELQINSTLEYKPVSNRSQYFNYR